MKIQVTDLKNSIDIKIECTPVSAEEVLKLIGETYVKLLKETEETDINVF